MVVLAYMPDIAAHAGVLGGLPHARVVTHSVLFAVLAGLLIAPWLRVWFGVPPATARVVAIFSLLLHDVLDLMQATDRHPFWPLDLPATGMDLQLIPVNSVGEAVWFAIAFCVVVAVRRIFVRRDREDSASASTNPVSPSTSRRMTRVYSACVTLVLLTVASGTHYLRQERERAFSDLNQMLKSGAFSEVLARADGVNRWPGTAKPGRVDYMVAEAYLGLGDRASAKPMLLKACAADPDYFWPLADLAVLYASSPGDRSDREALVAPVVEKLRRTFATHADLKRVCVKIDRLLGENSIPEAEPGSSTMDSSAKDDIAKDSSRH